MGPEGDSSGLSLKGAHTRSGAFKHTQKWNSTGEGGGEYKTKHMETRECTCTWTQINKPPHGGFHGRLAGDNEALSPPVCRLVFEVISVNTRDIYLLPH